MLYGFDAILSLQALSGPMDKDKSNDRKSITSQSVLINDSTLLVSLPEQSINSNLSSVVVVVLADG